MVRDGMGWFTKWGLISYLLVDYGWSVGQKMVLFYVVSSSLFALIPNFIQIGQKTQNQKFFSFGWLGWWVVGISNSFYIVFVPFLAPIPNFIQIGQS